MSLGSTQPCHLHLPIVQKSWEPQRLGNLRVFPSLKEITVPMYCTTGKHSVSNPRIYTKSHLQLSREPVCNEPNILHNIQYFVHFEKPSGMTCCLTLSIWKFADYSLVTNSSQDTERKLLGKETTHSRQYNLMDSFVA